MKADGIITLNVVKDALALLEIDHMGFDYMDRMILLTIIDKFGGGPVGLDTIAAAISEESDTIEDVYEPFLIQNAFSTAPRAAGSPPGPPMSISDALCLNRRRANFSRIDHAAYLRLSG